MAIAVKVFLPLAAVTLLSAACADGRMAGGAPAAKGGIIDLRRWDFSRDGAAALSGEWGFYWGRLLRDSGPQDRIVPAGRITLPGIWNGRRENGRVLTGDGFATYVLNVLLPAGCGERDKKRLALKLPDLGTAYALFINGTAAGRGGTVGESAATAAPGFRPDIIECVPENDEIRIALQVSNFYHRKGGAWEKIYLGPAALLRDAREKRLAADFFLFGSIFIMGMYHLVLFSMRTCDRSFLFFGLFCLLIAARIMVTGEYFVLRIVPWLPWGAIIGAEYITFYAGVPVFFLFLGSLFPGEFSGRVLVFTLAAGGALCALVIAAPPRCYTRSLQPFQVLSVCVCLYGLLVLARAGYRKREGAAPFIAGFIILFATVINDFLQSNMVMQTGYLVPAGLFGFIFSQSFFLSLRYTGTMAAVERLARENAEARYTLLQKRMSPHFVFNALNTVHSLIKRSPDRADRAVIMLADNYRFLLDHSFHPLVPFDTEWRFVENYLKFEELRFSDTVSAIMERRGDFSAIVIPPLSIQPLVENALKHGMMRGTGHGVVSLAAVSRDGVLSVVVRDNGPGLDPRCHLFSRSLGNIRKRLAHYFADVALDVENAREGGLLVRLSFRYTAGGTVTADAETGCAHGS